MSIKHKFVSAVSDTNESGKLGPNAWNDDHVITPTLSTIAASLTLAAPYKDVYKVNAATADVNVTLPSAAAYSGPPICLKRIDASSFNVVILTQNSQTIDGDTSFRLLNQWQYVTLFSDGINWIVIANN